MTPDQIKLIREAAEMLGKLYPELNESPKLADLIVALCQLADEMGSEKPFDHWKHNKEWCKNHGGEMMVSEGDDEFALLTQERYFKLLDMIPDPNPAKEENECRDCFIAHQHGGPSCSCEKHVRSKPKPIEKLTEKDEPNTRILRIKINQVIDVINSLEEKGNG